MRWCFICNCSYPNVVMLVLTVKICFIQKDEMEGRLARGELIDEDSRRRKQVAVFNIFSLSNQETAYAC